MDRRSVFGLFAVAAVAAPAAVGRAQVAGEAGHRVAIHVDQSDMAHMTLALGNATNMLEHYKPRGEEVAIEIVAYSQGLHMLREDTSPVKEEIRELRKTVPQVAFAACNHTKTGMERREGKPVLLIAEATIVPAGVVRLLELQEQGYAYVKP